MASIEAFGTDAFGAFEVWLVIRHNDGTQARISADHQGYDQILDSLSARYPSISPNWLDEMAQTPWDAERTLYSRDPGAVR